MVKGQPRKSTALFHVYGQKGATPMTKRTKYSMLLCNAKREIYEPTDITESKLEEIGGLTFHISYGDIYVGISPDTATTDDILVVVDSIK